jgi:hypothetical protein
MTVKEGNKAIIKFMKLPMVEWMVGTSDGVETECYKHPMVAVPSTIDGMQYRWSWSWLMPVVHQITKSEDFVHYDGREGLLQALPYGNIEDVYNEVVKFITKSK